MKTWSKIVAAALGLLAAVPAMATQSRINSLSGSEKSYTIRDEANIYGLPQFLVDHGNEVDVDNASGGSYGRMNIRYALSDDAVLLLFGIRSPWLAVTNRATVGGNTPASQAGFTPGSPDPVNHQFGIGFGTKLGDTLRLGTTIAIGGSKNSKDANDQQDATMFQLNFGLGFDLSETNSLDFGIRLEIGSFTNIEQGSNRFVSDGLISFGLLGKGEFQVHPIAKIVPYLKLDIDSFGILHAVHTQFPANETRRGAISNTRIQVGADLAINPAERVLVQPGVGLMYQQSVAEGNPAAGPNPNSTAEDQSAIMPYYGFAAEAQAFDWLALRVGARQTIKQFNQSNTVPQPQPTNEKHTSTVQNSLTTGLGISLRGWQIDLNVNPTFFNNNIFAVSGVATTPYAVDFAIVYDW